MANMMKAAVVRELGKPLAIEEVPVPEPKENQILVRIAAIGICHTDLSLQVVVDDGDGLLVMVSTESPDFATADGLNVRLTDLAVKAKLAKGQG